MKIFCKKIIPILIIAMFFCIIPKTENAVENNLKIGDINGDEVIDSRDTLKILEHIAASTIPSINQKHSDWILTGEKFKFGDINEDGIIDSIDTLREMEYIAASTIPTIEQKHSDWKTYIEKKWKSIEVTQITLDRTVIKLEEGKSTKLISTISPTNATNKVVTWSSSDSKVATVDGIGNVTGLKAGITIITAKTINGLYKTCQIEVTEKNEIVENPTMEILKSDNTTLIESTYSNDENEKIEMATTEREIYTKNILKKQSEVKSTGITLKQTDCTVPVGTSLQLNATIQPTNTTNKTITWVSSNNNIAKVNKKGVVKGIKPGKITITASTSNGKKATCIIRVNIPAKSISLNTTNMTLYKGSTQKFVVSFNPTNTTSKEIRWESLKPSIASVNSNGVVTAKENGETTIRATSKYGKIATCKIKVIDKIPRKITKITLQKSIKAQQGCEIYNNRLFMFSSGGKCNVYNLKTNKFVNTFTLPNGKNNFPHCNAVSFSKQFYKKTDKYPLLYINAYNDKGVQDGVCYVYRLIVGADEKFKCELKQTIKIGFINTSIWKNVKDTKRTFGNFVIDTDNNYMYVYNLRLSEKKTRFFKFKIPNISNKNAIISQKDIMEVFDCKLMDYIQDSCYYKGCIYILSGINDSNLWRLNLKTKVINEITLPKKPSNLKYFEPESIAICNGSVIVSYTDYGKTYTYKIDI